MNNKRQWLLAFCVIALSVTAGCATIVGGSKHTISVNSNVQQAEVMFDGQVIGTTPFTGSVPKHKDAVLMVQKKGYRSVVISMNTSTSLYFWGNLLSTYSSLTGSTVDIATSSMWEYSPNTYYANLEPESKTPTDRTQFIRESKFRHFVIYNYDQLEVDLSRMSGEYLDALYEVIPARSKSDRLAIIDAAKANVGIARGPSELVNILH